MEKMGDDDDVEQDREDDVMIGSSLSDGKIVIKLKIPKMAKEGKRVCLVCKKEFSSGKALGGHMRVHVQNPSFLKPGKKIKKSSSNLDHSQTKPYYLNSVNHEGVPICSQCGKTFPSMKSLFGHMRCHPERVWRGILPPPNAAVNHHIHGGHGGGYGSGYGGDQVVDLTKYLKGWSVTEKRGRRGLKPADHDHDVEDDDYVLLEAVENLMSLANYNGPGPSSAESDITERQMKVEVVEGSNSNSLTNKDVDKGKAVDHHVIEQAKIEFNDNEELDTSHNTTDMLKVSSKYKKRKKMKLMIELDQQQQQQQQQGNVVDEACRYKCTTSNKCFSSHQALGGHRSSHNKSKVISSEDEYGGFLSNENNLFSNSSKEVEFGLGIGMGIGIGIGIHQCKICDKIFATGQALGGHKRCHWSGKTTNEPHGRALSSQITSTGETASRTESGKKVLDFDLNEIPTAAIFMEDGIVNGYASSSYNSNTG